MSVLGPVSTTLEADVSAWIRRHGIIVWLDADGEFTAFTDRLAEQARNGDLPYRVHGFRDSHLQLMLEVEALVDGLDPPRLLVHLPGFNEASVRNTPLLELYAAGKRYRKRLDTLVTEAAAGRVPPDQITAFVESGVGDLSQADAWLAALLGQRGDGLAEHLRALSPTALIDDLLGGGFVARHLGQADAVEATWRQLATWTGLTTAWRKASAPGDRLRAEDVAFAASSWALAVEYVHDLRRPPVDQQLSGIADLPTALQAACMQLAQHLRERHDAFYERTADEAERWLSDEVAAAKAEDLGKIDTFRFEEEKVLEDALCGLAECRWDAALTWARDRLDGGSFWVQRDPNRRAAWQLVEGAAQLGRAIAEAGASLGRATSLEAAATRYAERGGSVDRAHRHLEQRRTALLDPRVPRFDALRSRLDGMRAHWRVWADAWAREFNTLCTTHGFLPPENLQQRALFDQVVRPFAQQSGCTAYFVVDALRFEMAQELFQAIDGTPATTVHLKPRLAELPSVTEVGMNVLAPVNDGGRLHPAITGATIKGFSTGEYRVSDPDSRRRAMQARVGGRTCPWLSLAEVLARDADSLKRAVAQAELLVVHSQEIDAAGEKGVGPTVFDAVMQSLRAAWQLLREAGVRRFVFTADHGFLLHEGTGAEVQAHGRRIDPKRRHVLSEVGADHSGEVRVPLADLGYVGCAGHLMFPETTAVFDRGRRSSSFVHGGNSLQERLIPVLTVVHRAAAGADLLTYRVDARALDGVAGMHCLEATVAVEASGALDFGGTSQLELALRAVDASEVTVDLCQVRGAAQIAQGAIAAEVGKPFEVFFRLLGSMDARVAVEVHHCGRVSNVRPGMPEERFAVTVRRRVAEPDEPEIVGEISRTWLEQLPEGGVRQLFEHIAAHGAVTEGEAAGMLGNARAVRKFALRFEEYAARAPFAVGIQVVSGVKRYVREGA